MSGCGSVRTCIDELSTQAGDSKTFQRCHVKPDICAKTPIQVRGEGSSFCTPKWPNMIRKKNDVRQPHVFCRHDRLKKHAVFGQASDSAWCERCQRSGTSNWVRYWSCSRALNKSRIWHEYGKCKEKSYPLPCFFLAGQGRTSTSIHQKVGVRHAATI